MEYKHFSHQHNLNIYQVQQGQQLRCSGCESLCHESVFACWQCNFFLHDYCANANRYVKHPSHSLHPLILIPYPTYSSGSFLCNACGASGSAFSYCCAPYKEASPCICKICSKLLDSKHWAYCCAKCDINVHTFCATREVKPGLYQMDDASDSADTEAPPGTHDQTACEANEAQPELALSEDAVVELYKLQLQMQMAEQLGQMMASFNVSSLA
ncbi:hypothetical protein F0562_015837 [Nyssa sinensis]|uniref:Uncharacterized protein n=1 Tax=Nyssa sinensis TaxID=561372 RepID=A0A5J4ZI37_9ASTE|nr:hypothetical protein F0562_015837 [Nyssa sinensis]